MGDFFWLVAIWLAISLYTALIRPIAAIEQLRDAKCTMYTDCTMQVCKHAH